MVPRNQVTLANATTVNTKQSGRKRVTIKDLSQM